MQKLALLLFRLLPFEKRKAIVQDELCKMASLHVRELVEKSTPGYHIHKNPKVKAA